MPYIYDVRHSDKFPEEICCMQQVQKTLSKELRSIHPSSSDSKCRCVINRRLTTMYEVLKVQTFMAQWLSWLERRPVTAEVTGSSPVWVVHMESQLSWESICLTSRGSQVRALQVPFSYADVAQLAEQLICNQQVIGSSPIIGFYTISY